MPNAALPDSPELAAADTAAENLKRNGNDVTLSGVDPSREAALDDAFASVPQPTGEEAELGKENGGVERPLPGKPKDEPAEKQAAEPKKAEAPTKPKEEPASKAETKPAEEKKRRGLLDDVLDEPAAKPEDAPEKAYEDIKLRSDASPKTQETFDAVKKRALERENTVRAELQASAAKVTEYEAKLAEIEKKQGALPEDVAAELKEHREFRALHDVSSRPEFKQKFDSRIDANFGFMYEMFKQEGWTDDKVKALQAFPESQRIEFIEKKILPHLTDGQRRAVEAKIYDNVNIAGEKAKALEAARTDAEKILAEQRALPLKQQQQQDTEFAGVLRPRLQKLAFIFPKEVPTTATSAQKAEIEAHNVRALEYQEDVTRAIKDKSPETRSEVILAVPLARHLKRENLALLARAEAAEAKLAAITKAGGTGRLGKAAAPDTGTPATRPAATNGDDAVDQLFQQASGRPAT